MTINFQPTSSSNNNLHHSFKTIGLVGRPRNDNTLAMHKNLFQWLSQRGYHILMESDTGFALQLSASHIATLEEIGMHAQLAIVIGGDGNMLGKARVLSHYNIPLIGINRGYLGFLTDIDPNQVYEQLEACLNDGEFFIEERFLLEACIKHQGRIQASSTAINEVVIHPDKVAHMIDFQVYIDDKFAFTQRSDGLIIATPTGSTAYCLSAGGPILTPQLNAIALVPMFPHTLSSRPLVIDGNSKITMRFAEYNIKKLEMSCDSQVQIAFDVEDTVLVQKSPHSLKLLHLNHYNYYNVLSTKLGWLKKLF